MSKFDGCAIVPSARLRHVATNKLSISINHSQTIPRTCNQLEGQMAQSQFVSVCEQVDQNFVCRLFDGSLQIILLNCFLIIRKLDSTRVAGFVAETLSWVFNLPCHFAASLSLRKNWLEFNKDWPVWFEDLLIGQHTGSALSAWNSCCMLRQFKVANLLTRDDKTAKALHPSHNCFRAF